MSDKSSDIVDHFVKEANRLSILSSPMDIAEALLEAYSNGKLEGIKSLAKSLDKSDGYMRVQIVVTLFIITLMLILIYGVTK